MGRWGRRGGRSRIGLCRHWLTWALKWKHSPWRRRGSRPPPLELDARAMLPSLDWVTSLPSPHWVMSLVDASVGSPASLDGDASRPYCCLFLSSRRSRSTPLFSLDTAFLSDVYLMRASMLRAPDGLGPSRPGWGWLGSSAAPSEIADTVFLRRDGVLASHLLPAWAPLMNAGVSIGGFLVNKDISFPVGLLLASTSRYRNSQQIRRVVNHQRKSGRASRDTAVQSGSNRRHGTALPFPAG